MWSIHVLELPLHSSFTPLFLLFFHFSLIQSNNSSYLYQSILTFPIYSALFLFIVGSLHARDGIISDGRLDEKWKIKNK